MLSSLSLTHTFYCEILQFSSPPPNISSSTQTLHTHPINSESPISLLPTYTHKYTHTFAPLQYTHTLSLFLRYGGGTQPWNCVWMTSPPIPQARTKPVMCVGWGGGGEYERARERDRKMFHLNHSHSCIPFDRQAPFQYLNISSFPPTISYLTSLDGFYQQKKSMSLTPIQLYYIRDYYGERGRTNRGGEDVFAGEQTQSK